MIVTGKPIICTPGFVFDGDTLNLSFAGEQFKCRLQWIDCPESQRNGQSSTDSTILAHWEWANKAKEKLASLIAGKQLIAIPLAKDIYDRWLCDLYVTEVLVANNIQILLAKSGMCVTFFPYDRFAFTTRELSIYRGILTAVATANRKKIGFWSVPNFILPHEFKKLSI
jgi:endonuclease YncB( thermonuclease family)